MSVIFFLVGLYLVLNEHPWIGIFLMCVAAGVCGGAVK